MLDFGFFNMDCMQGMKEFPDNYFDLAIVDPPYGGSTIDDPRGHFAGGHAKKYNYGSTELGTHFHGRGRSKKNLDEYKPNISVCRTGGDGGGWKNSTYGKKINHWDVAPTEEYFNELFRVSKNQVIWGGNYFELPPTRCFVVWKKLTISEDFSMAMCEYAWTSFNDNAKVFEYAPQGKAGERFHPTQKPVALYEWLLNRYAKPGDTILDTHVGSASSLIACRNTNHKYVGFEIDETYYALAKDRLDRESAQMNIFDFIKE
jgi:site-specific DNA-methyltransferase (adenine-specific)